MASTDVVNPRRLMPGTAWSARAARAEVLGQAPLSSIRFRWLFRWPGVLTLAVSLAIVCELTYVFGELSGGGRAVFMGQVWAPHDVAQYVGAMNDGAAGAVLIKDRLSPEPHDPALIYGFYVGLGWLTGFLGIDSEVGYRAAGLLGRVFVLASIYSATGLVSTTPSRRWLALILAAFGGGLASLIGLTETLGGFGLKMAGREFQEPEFGTFLLLFASPHLMFGLGLLLLAAQGYARSWRRGHLGSLMLAAAATVALSLVNSYSLATLCAVVGMHALVMTILARRFVWRGLFGAAVVFVCAAPVLLYGILTFVVGTDPFWGIAYGRQNQTPTPVPVDVLTAFGLTLALAVAGAPLVARRPTTGRVLVLVWIVTAAAMMYLPVGAQRRFAFGLQPLLAMLAAFTLPALWSFVRARRPFPLSLARPFATLLLLQALFGSTAFLYVAGLAMSQQVSRFEVRDGRGDFVPVELRPAAFWLAERTGTEAIVLGEPTTGNYLIHAISGRVYIGHWSATVDYAEKRKHAAWFFGAPMDAERRKFLARNGITHVVYGPFERLVSAEWPYDAKASGLTPIYDANGVAILEVARP